MTAAGPRRFCRPAALRNQLRFAPDPGERRNLSWRLRTPSALLWVGWRSSFWPHANCTGSADWCYDADIDINTIAQVQYDVDAGSWLDATPTDGTLDSDVEAFSFQSAALTADTHALAARTRNSVGNESAAWSDSVTIASTVFYYLPAIRKN